MAAKKAEIIPLFMVRPDGMRSIPEIELEAIDAREYSPLDPVQMEYWKRITPNDPAEVQALLDKSPTYQAMLRDRGRSK